CSCDTNCGRCADNFQIRIVLDQSCCLVCRFLRLVIAVSNLYQFQSAVFLVAFHDGLHSFDPCVLVSCLRCSGKNSELSLAACNIKYSVHKSLAYCLCTSLVNEYLTAVFIRSGVEGRYFDSCVHSLFQFSLKSIYVVCCDADRVKILGDQVVKNLDLSVSCCCFRIYNLYCCAFCLYSLFKRSCSDLEESVTCGFSHQSDLLSFSCCEYRACCTKNHCSAKKCTNNFFVHVFSSLGINIVFICNCFPVSGKAATYMIYLFFTWTALFTCPIILGRA